MIDADWLSLNPVLDTSVLSYSLDPAEMSLSWRLQTFAAAPGIVEMYVPQH